MKGSSEYLNPTEIRLIKKWINFNYNIEILDLNVDEVVPVCVDKEGCPRLFEVKFRAHETLILNEDELYKIIQRL